MSKRKKTQAFSVIHPVFVAVKEYTLEPFWCDFLESLSFGTKIEGVEVGEKSLKIGNEEFDISCFSNELELEERAETSMQIVRAMRENLGIMSESEKFMKEIEKNGCQEKSSAWNKKNKVKRELVLLEFTEKEQKEKSLTNEERQSLFWFLVTAIELGCIKADSIQMEDGKIMYIDGLLHESGTYNLKEFSFPPSKNSSKTKAKPKLRLALRKYILSRSKSSECR